MSELLLADVERYCLAAGIEPITAYQYRRSVRCLSEYLGRPALRSDLNESTINRWLESVAQRCPDCTTRNRKRGITPVWNWLAQTGAVPFYNSRALRKVKVEKRPPRAWSIAQVQQLLAGAADIKGTLLCGVSGADLMTAWVRVAYETGIRRGDLGRLQWSQLDGNELSFSQHKTKGAHVSALSPATLTAVQRLRKSGSVRIFVLQPSGLRRWETLLFQAAARYGFTRAKGQATGTLRKTAATETARVDGLQAAAELLGHRSGTQVTRDHYVQPEALSPRSPPQALIDALANPHPVCSGVRKQAG
jgi:integrase